MELPNLNRAPLAAIHLGHRVGQGDYCSDSAYLFSQIRVFGEVWGSSSGEPQKVKVMTLYGKHASYWRRRHSPHRAPPLLLYIGWVGVGWQRHCKTYHSRRELDNQGTAFFVFAFLAVGHSWLSS